MKGVIVLLFLTVSLVCIIPAQSFGASDHPYVLEWGGFGITKDGQFLRPHYLDADDEETKEIGLQGTYINFSPKHLQIFHNLYVLPLLSMHHRLLS